MILDLLLSVTNFCLGSCVYCRLKELRTFNYDQESSVASIRRLLEDPLLEDIINVHITGGEPILSPKTYEIFKLLHELKPHINCNMPISGFFPETTYRYLKKILPLMPQLRVDISIDGPPEIHSKTRGRGSHTNVLNTIMLLKTLDLNVQLQITIMPSNHKHIKYVIDMAENLNLGYYLTFPRFGLRFGHNKDDHRVYDQEVIDCVDAQIQDTWCALRPLNARIWAAQKAIWEGKDVYVDCQMGRKSIDVDPFGNVYPCMVYSQDQRFGNINTQPLSEMLTQFLAARILTQIDARACQPCLMPCCPHKTGLTIDGEVYR